MSEKGDFRRASSSSSGKTQRSQRQIWKTQKPKAEKGERNFERKIGKISPENERKRCTNCRKKYGTQRMPGSTNSFGIKLTSAMGNRDRIYPITESARDFEPGSSSKTKRRRARRHPKTQKGRFRTAKMHTWNLTPVKNETSKISPIFKPIKKAKNARAGKERKLCPTGIWR